MSKASRCITAVLADLTEDDQKIVQESVADFKQRIGAIMRQRERGRLELDKRLSDRPCVRKPTDRGYYPPSKTVGSGQRTIKQDDSTGIVERRKPTKPTRKTKIQ